MFTLVRNARPSRLASWLAVAAALALGAPSLSFGQPAQPSNPPAQQPSELDQALDLLRFGEHAKAADALEKIAAANAGNDTGTQALYFAARAREAGGQLQPAVRLYRQFLTKFADHALSDKVRFRLAECLIRGGDVAEAANLYGVGAARLGSPERTRELASQYLALADKMFEGVQEPDPLVPGRTVTRTNPQAAHGYYSKAMEIGLEGMDRLKARRRIAESLANMGNWAAAGQAYQALSGDLSLPLNERQDAQFLAAAALQNAGQPDQAAGVLLAILADGAGKHPRHADALWTLAQLYSNPGWDITVARNRAEEFLKTYATDGRVPQIRLWLARIEAANGLNNAAAERFEQFIAMHSGLVDDVAAARYEQAQALHRARRFEDAEGCYRRFIDKHASHAYANQARAMLHQLSWDRASTATDLAKRQPKDATLREQAIAALKAYLAAYPAEQNAVRVLQELGNQYEQAADYSSAIEAYRRLSAQFPQASHGAILRIAFIYENLLKEEDRALEEYRRLQESHRPDGGGIERLTRAELAIRTERVYGSHEAPMFTMDTRNIKEMTCRAFKLDLQEYFRRKRETGNVEQLMVDVLKPDATWTAAIPSYRDYRLLTSPVTVPLAGAGAYIIAVSNEKFRGTTLVLVSDLEMIVKDSPHQVLVLALNSRTKQPMPGVDLLLYNANGQHSFVGKTNADGIFDLDFNKPIAGLPSNDPRYGIDWTGVRLFAASSGNYAFHNFDFQGFGQSAYSPRALAFTDRPLYRGSEVVGFKVLARNVANGDYVLPSIGSTYHVICYGPRNEALWEKDVKLGLFGTAYGTLALGSDTPTGTYRLQFNGANLPSCQVNFEVRPFERPEYQIAASFDRALSANREPVKLTLNAARYSGAPVANATLNVRVFAVAQNYQPSPDAVGGFVEEQPKPRNVAVRAPIAQYTLTTNADGKAEVQFVPALPGTPRADVFFRLLAEVKGTTETGAEVVQVTVMAVTATSAFARVSSKSNQVLAGEEISLTVRAETPINTPVALAGTLRVYRGDAVTEFDPKTALFSTAVALAENGRAEVKFRMKDTGAYTAVFEAYGKMSERVSSTFVVNVVDPSQNERRDLVAMTDKARYLAGEKATLTILAPAPLPTALLTVEAERVLHYRLINVAGREMKLELPMDAAYMPNVRVSLVAIHEGKQLLGETEISVVKLLNLSLKADKPIYKPGDKCTVTVQAANQLGQPVKAEVALAVVDEAVFDLEADTTPDIRAFFYNVRREIAVRTGASVGWAYAGTVKDMDPDLLKDRRLKNGHNATPAEGGEWNEEDKDSARRDESLREEMRKMSDALEGERSAAPMPQPSAPGGPADEPSMNSSGGRGGFSSRSARGGGGAAAEKAQEMLSALSDSQAARQDFRFTAIFAADIVTDDQGFATVQFTLPESVTTWRFVVRGITTNTEVGEAREKAKTVKPFYGQIDAPRVCTEGDRFIVGAQFFNETDKDGEIRVALGETPSRNMPVAAVPALLLSLDAKKLASLKLSADDVLRVLDGANLKVRPEAFVNPAAPEATLVGVRAPQTLMDTVILRQRAGVVRLKDVAKISQVAPAPQAMEAKVNVPRGGATRATLNFLAENAGQASISAGGNLRDLSDLSTRGIQVEPFGVPFAQGFSGMISADGRAAMQFNLPNDYLPTATQLQIQLTPTLFESVLESLNYLREYPYGCIEQTVNRFAPALQVFAALRELEQNDPNLAKETKAIVEDGLARVLSQQNQDGGWGWWANGTSNPQLTALCYEALILSQRLDFPVPMQALQNAQNSLMNYLRGARGQLDRPMAIAIAALAMRSEMDALNRNSAGMVANALGRFQANAAQATADIAAPYLLAAARVNAGRPASVLDSLVRQAKSDKNGTFWVAGANEFSYGGSDVETTALALEALAQFDMNRDLQDGAVKWLESQKQGAQWRATRDTGVVIKAYVAYLKNARVNRSPAGKVNVMVNGKAAGQIDVGQGRRVQKYTLTGLELLRNGQNTVELVSVGAGQPRFYGDMKTVVAAEQVPPSSNKLAISRAYMPGPDAARREDLGRRMFDVIPGGSQLGVALESIGEGELVAVQLTITADMDRDEIMVEDPLPAGIEPITKVVSGTNRFEHREGKVVMFFDRLRAGETNVTYLARALRPGAYIARPAMARMMYFPEIAGRSGSGRLAVIPAAARAEMLKATPMSQALSLREAATLALSQGNTAEAAKALQALLKFEGLRADVIGEIRTSLLTIAFDGKDFTGIREQIDGLARIGQSNPRFTLSQALLAGEAFRQIRPAQAVTYYRDALSYAYSRELEAAAVLGDPAQSVNRTRMVLERMPDSDLLYRDMAGWAESAAKAAPAGEADAVFISGMKRLAAEAAGGFWNRYGLFAALMRQWERQRFAQVRAMSEAWLKFLNAERDPLADEITFLAAFSSFQTGDRDAAKRYATTLVEGRYLVGSAFDKRNREFFHVEPSHLAELRRQGLAGLGASQGRNAAAQILAQLAHASGDLAEAVKWYAQAAGDFQDARLALNELTQVEFSVPAFVRAKLNSDVQVQLSGRNIQSVELAVYPFDLLYCFTARKHLRDLHTIDLTGLKPAITATPTLKANQPYAPLSFPVSLGKLEKGAYLVLIKAGDRLESTIVLVSDLEATARRDGGVVRVTVTTSDGKPVEGAYVKVSDGNTIVATGTTDIRGIFQAASGNAVLVERKGEYALVPNVK